ncbi:hypothetical protein OG453_07280 [Streptomyces sp. NBC_01381]|uniref:hypothetical protein n=1 Tax=Streptomyces sp. NBC_01381 TaxID=2903845 RepID=UPI002255B6E1|nr:hypothetical protein [Streptomyces sp. NBC_01381]MCX4666470.1 hypothetical protein [Streptomyces sp. NBC_01381]
MHQAHRPHSATAPMLGPAHYLGYVYDAEAEVYGGTGPYVRVRLAAPVTRIGPARPAPASGQTLLRLLADPHHAVDLFGWGPEAHRQADAAARAARDLWGYAVATKSPVVESPQDGICL